MYLPGKLVPENIYDMPFEDFLKLLAMAEIARDLRIEDIEVGVKDMWKHIQIHNEG